MKLLYFTLLFLNAFQLHVFTNTMQGTDFTTVGQGSCQHDNLQSAIDATSEGGPSVIRVVSQDYHENLILDDIDVEITGGYTNCEAAANNNKDQSSFTVIGTDTLGPVLTITGSQPSTIHIENMRITEGHTGIFSEDSTVDLTMKTVTVFNNNSRGVIFENGHQMITLEDTIITANSGGPSDGFYNLGCIGPLNKMIIKGNSALTNRNTPAGNGGLIAFDGCHVDVYAPTIIANNNAGFGGGVLSSGSVVNLYGVTIEGNTAATGGGIAVHNDGEINMYGVTLQENTAVIGAAIFAAGEQTSLTMTQSKVKGNIAKNNNNGRIVFISTGATVNIENSLIIENIVKNDATLHLYSEAVLNLKYVTIANNEEIDATIELEQNSSVNIESSIIHNGVENIVNNDGTGSPNIICAIVNETDTFDGNETVSVVNDLDILFVDPMNGDYHLTSDSPAIDYCATATNVNADYPIDIDGQTRGLDQPDIDNGGIYDLGADEYYSEVYIHNYHSGLWFNPEQNGHGLSLEVLADNRIAVYWYTYDNEGQQIWLAATGNYQGHLATLDVFSTSGALFPPLFNAEDVIVESWGQFEIEFTGCHDLVFSWQPENDNGFELGSMNMTRLTEIEGLSCQNNPAKNNKNQADLALIHTNIQTPNNLFYFSNKQDSAVSIHNYHSGLWFNPEQNGHGLSLEVLADNRIAVYWYTYDNEGQQIWLAATGNYQDHLATLDVFSTNGALFPPLFNAEDVIVESWGQFEIEFTGCHDLVFGWQPENDNGFEPGSMNMTRLTEIEGLSCQQNPTQNNERS